MAAAAAAVEAMAVAWAKRVEVTAAFKPVAAAARHDRQEVAVAVTDPDPFFGGNPTGMVQGQDWGGTSETASMGAGGTCSTAMVRVAVELMDSTGGKIASMTGFGRPCLPSRCCR